MSDCLWLSEEYNRQAAELNEPPQTSETGVTISPRFPPFTFLSIVMPNNDMYEFDICLLHGEVKALGARGKYEKTTKHERSDHP